MINLEFHYAVDWKNRIDTLILLSSQNHNHSVYPTLNCSLEFLLLFSLISRPFNSPSWCKWLFLCLIFKQTNEIFKVKFVTFITELKRIKFIEQSAVVWRERYLRKLGTSKGEKQNYLMHCLSPARSFFLSMQLCTL